MALANSLLQITQIVEAAQGLIPAIEAIRDIPEDEWEALIRRCPQLDALFGACLDVEHAVGHEPEA